MACCSPHLRSGSACWGPTTFECGVDWSAFCLRLHDCLHFDSSYFGSSYGRRKGNCLLQHGLIADSSLHAVSMRMEPACVSGEAKQRMALVEQLHSRSRSSLAPMWLYVCGPHYVHPLAPHSAGDQPGMRLCAWGSVSAGTTIWAQTNCVHCMCSAHCESAMAGVAGSGNGIGRDHCLPTGTSDWA